MHPLTRSSLPATQPSSIDEPPTPHPVAHSEHRTSDTPCTSRVRTGCRHAGADDGRQSNAKRGVGHTAHGGGRLSGGRASVMSAPDIAGQVRIFDTTLRDGEQAPGCTLPLREKLAVAARLARVGVDVLEAGFPASSPGEARSVSAVAAAVGSADGPVVCGLARATIADIDICAEALQGATKRRIHTFIATSDLHLEHKLRLTRAQVLDRVATAVCYARSLEADVEFSAEDASRSDPSFVCEVFQIALEAGATTLNVPDTVGYAMPGEYAALVAQVCAIAARSPAVVVSTHCHDDLGMATANSLAGVVAGARQVECTINGLGERAGNASLEEVVMALHTRAGFYGVTTGIRTCELTPTSRFVSECTGVLMPPNKAIVGRNAFSHEAGIHQDGMLKHRSTYEIMTPESVGHAGSMLVLGKHSGRRAIRQRLVELGYEVTEAEFDALFVRFKALADAARGTTEYDLLALIPPHADSRRRSALAPGGEPACP